MAMRHARIVGAAVLATLVSAAGVGAQKPFAAFELPDTAVDVSRYTTIEECWAAVHRVMGDVAAQRKRLDADNGIVWDTVFDGSPDEEIDSVVVSAVAETARRCMARFAEPDTLPLDMYRIVAPLYMHAGWEEKARALVERRLAAVDPDNQTELVAAIDSVVDLYLGRSGPTELTIRPPRYDLVDEVVDRYGSLIADRLKRIRLYQRLAEWKYQDLLSDTVTERPGRKYMRRMVALLDSLTDAERQRLPEEFNAMLYSPEEVTGGILALAGLHMGGFLVVLDSLRSSTAAFVRLARESLATLVGTTPEAIPLPIGEQAPTLEGLVLCGEESCEPRPRRGRVSVVVFVSPGDNGCIEVIDEPDRMGANLCSMTLNRFRQLQDRFPDLDITIVARSHGYWGYHKEGITPQREAELTRRWIDSFGLERAALVMEETDYWRLPHPDERRIDRETVNARNYSFGGRWPVGERMWFLIDEDGIVVYGEHGIDRVNKPLLSALIEALVSRKGARAGT
jgi:peroxiredoxin